MVSRTALLVRIFFTAVFGGLLIQPQANTSAFTVTASISPIQHVFLVVMENKSLSSIWKKSSAPYINELGSTYAAATNYHAITHPSLPNYLTLIGGSTFSRKTNCSPFDCGMDAPNLLDNVEAGGLSWKAYMESMPSNCLADPSGRYAPRHNPFVYFDDIADNSDRCLGKVVPYSDLESDLASTSTTPNFAFITPNICSDMHDCSIKTGDRWLQTNLPDILNSPACTVDTCLVMLTWDEGRGKNNNVLTIFAGSGAQTGGVVSTNPYNHYSLLRTIEIIFGLPPLTGNDANANPMTDLLR